MKSSIKTQNSLVVLPFKNGSRDASKDYICDGFTEEIIFALAKIQQLKVISRTSSFFFKNSTASNEEISEKLDVNIILEGSVRIQNDSIRISAQLIKIEDNAYLWSETWNRKMDNLFELQDEISLLIADKLREHVGHLTISDHLVQIHPYNSQAYNHYLKGRYLFLKWNPEDIHLAIKEFEQAIALDSTMIDVYLGIADTYSFLAVAGFAPREESWAKANEALTIAKSIDEENPGLNYLLANQAFFTKADFKVSMNHIMRSLAREPTHADSQRFASFLYLISGKIKKAKEHLFYAKSIDPLNPETSFYEANYYYRTGQYELSNTILEGLLRQNDKNIPALIVSIYLKLKQDNWKEALIQIEQTPEEILTPDERLGLLSLAQISKGYSTSKELEQLIENAKDPIAHHAHAYLFVAYSMLESYKNAYAILQNLFEYNSSILLLSFSDPLSEPIRTTAIYQEFHSRIYPKTRVKKSSNRIKAKQPDSSTNAKDLKKLKTYMEEEKPFLNPSLSLRLLANSIGIHPNQLSWLLNNILDKNFNEYINSERIDHFKKLVTNPKNSHISLLGLAYESGFNSKSVFNTTFKKEVGMTPKSYQKSQLNP